MFFWKRPAWLGSFVKKKVWRNIRIKKKRIGIFLWKCATWLGSFGKKTGMEWSIETKKKTESENSFENVPHD